MLFLCVDPFQERPATNYFRVHKLLVITCSMAARASRSRIKVQLEIAAPAQYSHHNNPIALLIILKFHFFPPDHCSLIKMEVTFRVSWF